MHYKYPSVLTIAGSDSGGGAGIQADIKTFAALGCYGTTAITAITVQNTLGVTGIHDIPPPVVQAQIKAVMEDIAPAAIKIGMLHTPELAITVAQTLLAYPHVPVVLDPVMVATSGDRLIKDETIAILRHYLFPLATVVTPNLDEASVLTSQPIRRLEDMRAAAENIIASGCKAVLVKGGHLRSEKIFDVLLMQDGEWQQFESEYIHTNNVHGTGCTLSSAIAAFLARGEQLGSAVLRAKEYITMTIESGADVVTGHGNGPLNHFAAPVKAIKYEME